MNEAANGSRTGMDMRLVMGIITSLFIAMVLGSFGIIWARLNHLEVALAAHSTVLASRGERITKIEGVTEFNRLASEQQILEMRRLAEDLFQVKLQLQSQVGQRRSPP